jgi:hypothetical protein
LQRLDDVAAVVDTAGEGEPCVQPSTGLVD